MKILHFYKIVAYLIGGTALIMSVLTFIDLMKSNQTSGWDKVKGELVKCSIGNYENQRMGIVYQADIQYKYVINEHSYLGNSLHLVNGSTMNREELETILKDIESQSPLIVYVNPINNNESVLLTGVGMELIIRGLVFFAVFTTCGIYGIFLRG